ncbi:helicase-exonuclease AddAB subunit AddA [Culicoidibacter larvae]|uniref:DNA 3'-5' helicase n=1 Tax=Culicoidibacter larvae TaxID=2579976 RepID=A0A5R8QGB4_9FIRM|nr:helicase-exonuclease AddAB subunit AddA [Culicoidibacter larvae]TLG77081.1 helicase-exonuclease AddAB subunit AddA [Culicoidibacter larvae]
MMAKPVNSQWTDDQWRAIAARNKQVLVAAAAGSGKTAVLVERIIRRIIDEQLDISQLLVLTFTNAAASQMKARVRSALEDLDKQDAFVAEQLMLLESADISTFHAFCLTIIRQQYYLLSIDPNFRIGDDVELQLLSDEAMSETLEQAYADASEDFLSFVDHYTSTRNDDQLADFIMMVYRLVQAQADGLDWLDTVYQRVLLMSEQAIDEQLLVHQAKSYIYESARSIADSFFELSQSPGIPEGYQAFFFKHYEQASLITAQKDWEDIRLQLVSYDWGRMPRVSADDKSLEQEQAKDRFAELKKTMNHLRDDYGVFTAELHERQSKAVLPHLHQLIELVKQYDAQFKQRKAERILLDFNDIEHYTLRLLREFPDVRALYQQRFKEILVDEYQDTNGVQEAIIQMMLGSETSLFLVGDMKQSIYKFRMADPSLFQAKYERFGVDDASENLRIDLNYNFRSRSEVLDTANFLCKQLFGSQFDGIVYDDAAQLYLGNKQYPEASMDTELLFIDMQGDDEDEESLAISSKDKTQAQVIGAKVEQLLTSGFEVFDKRTKAMRPVTPKDIVVLTRSRGALVGQLEAELRRLEIPAYSETLGGYFNSTEVRNMLSLLQVIDNPYQDIAFVGLLRSPIFGLDENELLTIKVRSEHGTMYERASEYLQQFSEMPLAIKLTDILAKIRSWQQSVRLQPLSDFINQLYTETQYYQFVGGLPNGKLRQANLDILLNRAKSFEQSGYRGLFKFNKLIGRLQEMNKDLNNARTVTDNEDVVRIMTIHASKGLEFPVVIFADLQKQMNISDLRGDCFVHQDLGIALSYVNLDERYKMTTLAQQVIKDMKRTELIAEELRVFYVALTRAQEKVIMTMTLDNVAEHKYLQRMIIPEWNLPFHLVRESRRYSDWILRAVARHNSFAIFAGNPIQVEEWSQYGVKLQYQVINAKEALREQLIAGAKLKSRTEFPSSGFNEGHVAEVLNSFDFTYPFIEQTEHYAKQSVSEIKRMAQAVYLGEQTEQLHGASIQFAEPGFISERGLADPRVRGIYYHNVLQHIDFSRDWNAENFANFLSDLAKEQKISEQAVATVQYEQLETLFHSEVSDWMRRASRVRKELPFSLLVEAKEVYPDWQGASVPVLVQGIMDVVLELPERIILVDYKTDMVGENTNEAQLLARYKIQLALYMRALKQAYPGRDVAGYLYFIESNQLISAL